VSKREDRRRRMERSDINTKLDLIIYNLLLVASLLTGSSPDYP